MRLLIDANLSPALKVHLRERFPDSLHVLDLGIEGDDGLIWEYATKNSLMIVSKDADFYHRSKQGNDSTKVIWIRKRNCSTQDIVRILETAAIDNFITSEKFKCLIIA